MKKQSKFKIKPQGALRKKSYPKKKTEWSPVKLPEGGFVVLIDTRERQPLFINSTLDIPDEIKFKRVKLEHGDYSIEGYENKICIERKKQSDFESYISKEYRQRTLGKLIAMRDGVKWRGLVIEHNYDDLHIDTISPNMTKEKVRNHLASLEVHYGLHVFCHRDRETIERKVLDWLSRAYKYCKRAERYKIEQAGELLRQGGG